MCFYDQYRFACGDWKWGNFRQHCNREYRTGETCGMKLILNTIGVTESCKLCDKVDRKLRKRAFEVERITRWRKEHGAKRSASIEKSMDAIKSLDHEIGLLMSEKDRRRDTLGRCR